jgi:predicted DNA-binding transcriptional regulator AlpA
MRTEIMTTKRGGRPRRYPLPPPKKARATPASQTKPPPEPPAPAPAGPDEAEALEQKDLLTKDEAAEFLRISPRSLRRLRSDGTGPRAVQVTSRREFYRREDLEEWLRERTGAEV